MSNTIYSYLAEKAYTAYAASTGNKNYSGGNMPNWSDLPTQIKVAWECSAYQVSMLTKDPFAEPQRPHVWSEYSQKRKKVLDYNGK